jgi:hypothetical protein
MKPKEFWLSYETAYGDVFGEEKVNEDDIHVIEMAAYQRLMAEAVKLAAALEDINSVKKSDVEDWPVYWGTMANGRSGDALKQWQAFLDEKVSKAPTCAHCNGTGRDERWEG